MGVQLFTRYGLTAGEVAAPPASATLTRSTSGLIFMDLFDDGDVSDWTSTTNRTHSVDANPRYGAGAIRSTLNAASATEWTHRTFSGHVGDFVAQYWMRTSSTAMTGFVCLTDNLAGLLANPDNNRGQAALFRNTSQIQVQNGAGLTTLGGFASNVWYKLTHEVDVGADTASSRLNDGSATAHSLATGGLAGVSAVAFAFGGSHTGNTHDLDNLVVCKGKTVTCTGLPTGYSLRCTGFDWEMKTEAESAGTAVVDVLLLDWPLVKVEVLDASGEVVVAFTEYAFGGDSYEFTEGDAVAGDSALAVFLRSDVAPRSLNIASVAAAYDSTSGKTFFAYLQNPTRDLYASSYDHSTGAIATPVKVGTYPLTDSDDHGGPSITIDASGFLHIIWGGHNTDHQYSKSDSARDISAWTTTALHDGTYPSLTIEPATGDLYLLDRLLVGGGDPNGGLRTSDDGGATWSAVATIVDTTGFGGANRFYPFGSAWHDGKLWFAWTVYHSSTSKQTDVHVAYFDPSDGHLYTAAGTDLGTSITSGEHASCLVIDTGTDRAPIGRITTDASGVYITANVGTLTDSTIHTAVWDGDSWNVTDTTIPHSSSFGQAVIIPNSGTLYLLACERDIGGGDEYTKLNLYTSTDGDTWAFQHTVIDMLYAAGIERLHPLLDGGPFIAIAQTELEPYVQTSRASIAPSATDFPTILFGIRELW